MMAELSRRVFLSGLAAFALLPRRKQQRTVRTHSVNTGTYRAVYRTTY
jgi:hypothetical protein